MTVKISRNRMKRHIGQVQQQFNKLPKQAFQFWRKTTPKKTGNARRKTILRNKLILARYPYAERLDDGWSRQAPKGMSTPTLEYIKKITRRAIRK